VALRRVIFDWRGGSYSETTAGGSPIIENHHLECPSAGAPASISFAIIAIDRVLKDQFHTHTALVYVFPRASRAQSG